MTFPMWGTYGPDPTYGGEVECAACNKVWDDELTDENERCPFCQDIADLPGEIEKEKEIAGDRYQGRVVRRMAIRSAREKITELREKLLETGREV